MSAQRSIRFSQLLCESANGSPLWARVGTPVTSVSAMAVSAERALQAALLQRGEAIEPELASSTYVITCVY